MTPTRTLLLALAAAGALAAPVMADVYMWTDADGTVHYGDKPGSRDAKKLDIDSRSTDRSAVAERYQQRQTARVEANTASTERRASAAQQAADAAREKADKTAKCEEARTRLANYINSRRLYRLDESGERQYLDDAEIAEARTMAEKAVTESCD